MPGLWGGTAPTGGQEAVLGSSSVALNSVTYLSFLEGLLGHGCSLVRGRWDRNWDGSRSEEKRPGREGQDRAARGH